MSSAGTWPIDYSLTDPSAFSGASMQAACEEMAVDLLWNWTNRVFGTNTEAVRPVWNESTERPSSMMGLGPFIVPGWQAVFLGGSWFNLGAADLASYSAGSLAEQQTLIHLPGPVISVDSIVIDGATLDSTAYRVEHKRNLIRQDGENWPTSQDLSLPPDQVGTWIVNYTRGVVVPKGGQLAAATLAVQLAKAIMQDADCGLPQRIQSVTRQGVTVGVMLDTFQDLQDGRTGIWSIDSWIASVTVSRAAAGVRSIDVPRQPRWTT